MKENRHYSWGWGLEASWETVVGGSAGVAAERGMGRASSHLAHSSRQAFGTVGTAHL